MPRIGLSFLLCAGALLGSISSLSSAPADDAARRIDAQLSLQSALIKGREHLNRGHFKAAIDVLEHELVYLSIAANADYLHALAEAYQGYIAEQSRANKPTEAAFYQERLNRIDPGAILTTAPAKIASKPQTPPALLPKACGKIDDDVDPFAATNTRPASGARDILDQAEHAFDAKKYEEAARLYSQAEKLQKDITSGARGRWAYCKMSVVVTELGRQNSTSAPQALESEVRLALSMSPKLHDVGQDLLRRIEDRKGSTINHSEGAIDDTASTVKHTPRQGTSWAVAETTNFRIFHAQSREVAEKAAQLAETTRLEAARKWFGEPLAAWPTRCDIYLHNTADDYARATSQSPQCPGHSTMPMEGERVLARRIDLHCDDANMTVGILPHEVTHVVLAGRFPGPLPRWADEGMAVLSEPRERVEKHLRNLPGHAEQRQLFNVGQLMRLGTYPEPHLVGAFYAQSVSLVDYLSQLHGPQVFTKFMTEAMRGGYEPALQKYYGYKGFQDLELAWQHQTLGNAQTRLP